MIDFTYNNHLKYFIDDELFGYRTNQYQEYKVSVGEINKDVYFNNTFETEFLRVIDLIDQNLGPDKTVFISGGLDSEIAIRSFVKLGIKPNVLTIRFNNDYNDFEINAVEKLATELDIKVNYYDFDVVQFYLSGEADEVAKRYSCENFAYVVFLKILENINTPSILNYEFQLNKSRDVNNLPFWHLKYSEHEEVPFIKISKKLNLPIITEVFSYTPELMLHYLTCPLVKNLCTTRSYYNSTLPLKNYFLKNLVSDVKTSTKTKTRGYEKLTSLIIEANYNLSNLMPLKVKTDLVPTYDELIRLLSGNYYDTIIK